MHGGNTYRDVTGEFVLIFRRKIAGDLSGFFVGLVCPYLQLQLH